MKINEYLKSRINNKDYFAGLLIFPKTLNDHIPSSVWITRIAEFFVRFGCVIDGFVKPGGIEESILYLSVSSGHELYTFSKSGLNTLNFAKTLSNACMSFIQYPRNRRSLYGR